MRIPISDNEAGVMYTDKYNTYDRVYFVPDYIPYYNTEYVKGGRRMTYGEYKRYVKEFEIKH